MNQPNILHAPWEADGHNIFDAYSVMVASVGLASRTRDDAHEIARLIAAAPQMAFELEKALTALRSPQSFDIDGVCSALESVLRLAGVK